MHQGETKNCQEWCAKVEQLVVKTEQVKTLTTPTMNASLWTQVENKKNKGKMVMYESTSVEEEVQCHNGFSPLRILSDPIVENGTGP